jgi:hypothetical protein
VPSLVRLKRLAGDRDPLLNDWEKLAKAIELNEPPFDGACQKCVDQPAEYVIDVELSVLSERVLSGDQGVIFTPMGSVVTVESGTEYWNTMTIPHLLCNRCYRDFLAMYRWRTITRWTILVVGIILAPFIIYFSLACGLIGIVFMILLWFAVQRRWRRDTRLTQWILGVPLLKNAIGNEQEYSLHRRGTRHFTGER